MKAISFIWGLVFAAVSLYFFHDTNTLLSVMPRSPEALEVVRSYVVIYEIAIVTSFGLACLCFYDAFHRTSQS